MKKIILSIAFFLPFFVCAQEYKDPKAMTLLDEAVSSFDTRKGVSVDFTVKVENTRDDKEQSVKGKIWLKGEKFKLSVSDVETYFDGKTQSVYLKEANEVTLTNPDVEELKDINPVFLIKSYKKGYKIRYVESRPEDGKNVEIIDLYPEDLSHENSRITITIQKDTKRLFSVRIQRKDGINTILTINQYRFTPLTDNLFVFDSSGIKDIEIIDLR
jgi:outer membrane lipoprotein-sorting protein